MGGTHKFTSSVWIQSGSTPAAFQNGIQVNDSVTVSGTVHAASFTGDGSNLTGIGSAVFFAGSGSGISASSPASVDHVIKLDASTAVAEYGSFKIETTSSAGFNPNHFVFVKLTNVGFETLPNPDNLDFYLGDDRTAEGDPSGQNPFKNDLAAGVHRYIVYATNTGSAGATHAVYTSAFIEGYVNVPPVIKTPLQSEGVVQIPHDETTLTHGISFTASFEPNAVQNDFIRIFSASRNTTNPSDANPTDAKYKLIMKHGQDNIPDSFEFIGTGSLDTSNTQYLQVPGAGPKATTLPDAVLNFTASITGYTLSSSNENYADTIEPTTEQFTITLMDNWYVDHSASLDYSMSIVPPNTASIRNVRARIESGAFSGIPTDVFSTPILYDDPGTTRTSIDGLHDRYTSSIVRVSVMADITEPEDYETEGTHFTDLRISEAGDTNRPLNLKTFRFSGSMIGPGLFRATASAYGTEFNFNNVTESLGFSPLSYTAGTSTFNVVETNNINSLRHGNHHHISPMHATSDAELTVRPVPDIEISNIRVEVESGSFLTGVGAFERTASVLYGYTSTLRVSETSSLEGYEKSAEYISESVVRVRLLATITEPFGPHHTNMQSTLSTTGHTHTFAFHTASTDTASSAIGYNGQDKLVGHYTSSFVSFNLTPGVYNFNTSFNSDTNAGRDVDAINAIHASVSVSATPATEITNIVYETETAGYSETGSTDAMRTVLYGVPRHTLADSSSFDEHINAVTYASHSVTRFRVLADITEPFGPHHTASRFEKVWTADNESPITDAIHFSTGSTDTASSAIAYDSANRLLARYTSSWIGQQLSSGNNTAKTWTYTSGSITHTPHDLSGFITEPGRSTQLKINDTAKIELTKRFVEFEKYGHSASNATDTGVTNTIRTILYGSNRRTLVDSSSVEGHGDRTTAYASQSVSRYRVRFEVAEPVGPAVGSITIPIQINSGPAILTKNANTGSTEFESVGHAYDSQKRLIANYTSSWIGREIVLDAADYDSSANYEFAVKNDDVINNINNENGIIKESQQPATVTVRDTAVTEITNIRYETETFGYSEEPSTDTTRKVLYGVAHETNEDSSSYESHVSASLYASQSVTRFRVLATITEPVGPLHTASKFEKVWTSPLQSSILNTIHFNTSSADTASSAIAYDSSNRLVVHYTSSWIGQTLSSNDFNTGEQWKYTSGSISHEPENENGFITSSGNSSVITVFDTQPTIFSNFKTETETFGYSNEPTQDTFRKVLYGVAHKTVADSSSFDSHDSASLYASQSVSQFRIVARITEPVGPLQHTPSIIEKTFAFNSNVQSEKTETITFATSSIGFESSRSFFTEVGEFVTEYTTSFEGEALDVQTGALQERIWSISTGSVQHNPSGENSANSSSFTNTTVKVQNTEKPIIEKIFWETETFGYSNVNISDTIRTVLYGNNRTTDINSSSYENHPNSASYASQSVSRVRFRARITEPLGPAVDNFTVNFIYDGNDNETNLHTGSIGTYGGAIATAYENNQLVAHYTSSYFGVLYDVSPGGIRIHDLKGEISENINGENGVNESDKTDGTITVIDTPATQITNVRYETETFGYSGAPSTNTTRKVLYGDKQVTNTGTGSGDSGEDWESHASASLYASQSVTRFRVLATITEPVGPLHTASKFEKVWGSATNRVVPTDTLHFSTRSIDVELSSSEYNLSNELVGRYTSSWIGRGLSSSVYASDEHANGETYTYKSGSISHNPSNENAFTITPIESSTITVYDTQPTEFDNILLETETFGYSGIGTNDAMRKVLYGVPHHTLETTQSLYWATSNSASLYASQSVTQFRIYTKITEPVGPHHTGSILRQQFTSNIDSTEFIENIASPDMASINSSQIDEGSVTDAFDRSTGNGYEAVSNEILTIVFAEAQAIARVNIDADSNNYNVTSDAVVFASPDDGVSYFEQDNIINNETAPARSFKHFKIQFQNSDRITINEIEFFRTNHTEPIIYNNTEFDLNIDSAQIESSESFYDGQSRLVSKYTSSYFGVQLSSSNSSSGELWQYDISQIIHNPIDESLIIQPNNATISKVRVYDTAAPKYENFKTETETFGYSNEPTQDTIRTVLYGNTQITDINSSSYENHPSASIYASHSVSRFRVVTRITEPVGPLLHTGSRSNMIFNDDVSKTKTIVFGTASDAFVQSFSTPAGEFVAEYTSSWISRSLESGADFTNWTIQNETPIHVTVNENAPTNASSATILKVRNTEQTQINSIKYETETFGYSGEPSTDTTRRVLYGDFATTNANSESFANHVNSGSYASHSVSQFRVKARITEPVGPLHTASRFDQIWYRIPNLNPFIAPEFSNILHFSTSSNNVISRSFSDGAGRFIVEYTSSWLGQPLSASNATTVIYQYTSGSILHAPEGETGVVIDTGESSIINVIGTPKTIIKNLKVETETFGHSGIGIQNTVQSDAYAISRSILYGETATFADSSSFADESGVEIFAKNSVTQFRILADIIEPLGPLHTGSLIRYTKDANVTITSGEGDSEFILFSTASTQTASSDIEYDDEFRLAASYTSSFFGESLSPSRVLTDGRWHINIDTQNNVHHSPIDESGVNIDTAANDLYMVVSASKPVNVSGRTRVESFYSSSVDVSNRTETILYGFNRTLSASDANTIGDIWSGSAAVRFRPYIKITEPLGFRHFITEITMSTNNTSDGEKSRAYKFHTASLETASRSERVLNSEGRYVTSYTGSYHDGFTFAESPFYIFKIDHFEMQTGSNVTGIYMDSNGIENELMGNSFVTINETPPTEITNVRVEAETFSGSAVGADSRTTTILHGNTVTETDKTANAGYPTETARQQLTSIRLLADIAEPFGPHHTASLFTIGGLDGDDQVIRLHTGSADVSSSATSSWYALNGNQTTAYTSSFIPVQLSQNVFNPSIQSVVHEFENNKTADNALQSHAIITVDGPLSASVFVTPTTASTYWSASIDLDPYITYNKKDTNLLVQISSGISASAPAATSESVLTFPNHLNVLYTEIVDGLSFSATSGQDTGSLTIANSLMKDLTAVTPYTVNISGSNTLPGSGSSGNQPFTFNVIPAKPMNMDGMYWGTSTATGHEIGTTGIDVPEIRVLGVPQTKRLYQGSLSQEIGLYDSGDSAGTTVSNIVMAKDTPTGPVNYEMAFTPFTPVNQGNYDTTNRLFDHGDSGSLIVKINDVTVATMSLQYNFKTTDKDHQQNIAGNYVGSGTASFTNAHDPIAIPYAERGRLILTHVEPFNGVHQNIFNAGEHYPNGYQGWSARIELDDKLNDGYNKLEFEHVFDDGTFQSWQPFEWYYDDNINLAVTKTNAIASYSMPGSEPTFSRSGVSFFDKGVDITINIDDAFHGIAGPTYNKITNVMETDPSTGLTAEGVSVIDHKLNTTTNAKGLHFGTTGDIVPLKNETASLDIVIRGTTVSNSGTGDTKTVTIKQYNRDYSDDNTFTKTNSPKQINVGRFIDLSGRSGTAVSTATQENFFFEDLRWKHESMGDASIANTNDPGGLNNIGTQIGLNFAYWLATTNTDFQSHVSVLGNPELQVRWDGTLAYPNESYIVNNLPTSINYSSAAGDRYFYRAFDVGGGLGGTVNDFKITVHFDPNNPISRSDIFAQGISGANVDSRNVRIDLKFPGVFNAGNQGFINPGSAWGSAGGGNGYASNLQTDGWTSQTIAEAPQIIEFGNSADGHTPIENSFILRLRSGGNWKSGKVGGIMLMRIRMKEGFTGRITKIELGPY